MPISLPLQVAPPLAHSPRNPDRGLVIGPPGKLFGENEGWLALTPVSITPTTTPLPRELKPGVPVHTRLALIHVGPASVSGLAFQFGNTLLTPGRVAMRAASSAVSSSATPLSAAW